MKILYHHRIGSKDGQYVHIEELTGALRDLGHAVRIVGPSAFEHQPFGSESGFVAGLKRRIPRAIYELLELLYNGIDYLRLARAIRKFRPDVIYERYNLYLLSGLAARRWFKVPLIVEVNAPLFDERSRFGGVSLPRLADWAERVVWKNTDHLFTVTQVLATRLVQGGAVAERISVTPNGINPSMFPAVTDRDAAKARWQLENRVVLGFVGFAREWHGLEAVITLLAEHAHRVDLHFLLVGDGPARQGLESLARTAGVADRVTVTGLIERAAVAQYVGAFDIALQPSVVPYASPLKILEYMACANAIVAPDSPNIRELLTHEQDALLIDMAAPASFKAAVHRLIEDARLRRALGEAARQTLLKRDLTWAHNAREVVRTAQDLVRDAEAATARGRRKT